MRLVETLYKRRNGYEDEYDDEYEDEYEEEYEDGEVDSEDAAEREGAVGAEAEKVEEGGEWQEDIPVKAFHEAKKIQESDLEEQLAAQREEIEKLSAIIKTQLSEISDGHKKNTQLYQEIAVLESRVSSYEREHVDIRKENEQLCSRQRELEAELAEAREQCQAMQERESALRESMEAESSMRENCERRLYQLEHSKSWRLTEPLRRILELIKKIIIH